MTAPTWIRNPLATVEGRTVTDRLLDARSIAEEERIAYAADLTLPQARAVAILVCSATGNVEGLRRMLERDDQVVELAEKIDAKLVEYGRSEVPAITRMIAREVGALVQGLAARALTIGTEARAIADHGLPAIGVAA